MATTVPKEPLRTLVAAMANLPVDVVIWSGEPVPPVVYEQDARRITLDVAARRAVGRDEATRDYPDATTVRTTYKGQRVLTISVLAENFGTEQGFDLLESIRTQFQQSDTGETLNASDMSFNDSGSIRVLDVYADDRSITAAQLDIILNQTVTLVVTKTDPGGYATSVTMAGQDELTRAGADTVTSP